MSMTEIDLLGYTAGFLTTFSASPQLIYSYRSGDVKSFDLIFLLMLACGLALWTIYGLVIGSLPVIFFNFFGCILWLPIIWLKIREKMGA